MVRLRLGWVAVVLGVCAAAVLPGVPARAAPGKGPASALAPATSLARLFDNVAVGEDTRPGTADFDGAGRSLSAGDLAAAGWTPGRVLTVRGARLTWPRTAPGAPDNVRAAGQSVRLRGRGEALAFLVAGTAARGADAGGAGTVRYADGSRSAYRLTAPDWRTGPLATKAVALPHVNTPAGPLAKRARLYVVTVPLAHGRTVASVVLPRDRALHVFALSLRPGGRGWTGSWAAATSGYTPVGPWTDRTLRLVVHTSAGGPRARLRFENTFAAAPVRIGGATVAVRGEGAAAAGAPVPLTFGGARGVTVPAGAQALSDPVAFAVPADADLLVSFHLPGTVTAAPVHRLALQRSYLSEPGDHTGDTGPGAYPSTLTTWPFLTGVDVGGGPGTVVALGDSITDGEKSGTDANRRWPNVLAERLLRQHAVPRYGVLDEGISANRVVADRYPGDGVSTDTGGVSALHRLDGDVLAQTSVRTVVVFEGVNDVRWGATADEVVAGLRELAARAHARGVRVLAATIAPCEGEARCTAEADARRSIVNAWLRGSGGTFDGVLDFDAVLRDPDRPARLRPEYDSGDHLHPGPAGLAALADSVDLRLL
ncbi:SGNH/GDSL hydrolase family protein [Streptomyces griseoaurantiacus]|uniref:SGNH/GDSL hydrolase family protein n=1 Tax=Streptomyces griseoaurantiacus TaxID=68213 RepID=UPI00369272F8